MGRKVTNKKRITETPPEFFKWLDKKLDDLGLNDYQLSLRAGISNSVLSKARSGTQPIGYEACYAIADSLGERPETVMRLAGLLPKEPGWSSEHAEWNDLFDKLNEENREELLALGKVKAKRESNDKAKTR